MKITSEGHNRMNELEIMTRVKSNLRKFRIKIGYSQKNMADLLGIERSTYTYMELGKTKINLFTYYMLCEIFSVDMNLFFSEKFNADELNIRSPGAVLLKCEKNRKL